MKIRKAGETKLMREDLLKHGVILVDEKSINGKFRKLDRIAASVCSKTDIPLSSIATNQLRTNKGMFFTIHDTSRISDDELSGMLTTIS